MDVTILCEHGHIGQRSHITQWIIRNMLKRLLKQALQPIRKAKRSIEQNGADGLRRTVVSQCKVCQSRAELFQQSHGRWWYKCPECSFLQSEITHHQWRALHQGEGFTAGTAQSGAALAGFNAGTSDGGYREFWISKLCLERLGLNEVLLYGTGNTSTFQKLKDDGMQVYGCDFSHDVIAARRQQYGQNCFFHPDAFPDMTFAAIVAVEVFEHLASPLKTFRLLCSHISKDGGDLRDNRFLGRI